MVSVVVPIYNEESSIAVLYRELRTALDSIGRDAEIIFIDDGSTDGSWNEVLKLQQNDSTIRSLRFPRNYGKSRAYHAAIEISLGTVIVTLDADLQDDPLEIPNLVQKLEQGFDVVCGWRRVRQDSASRILSGILFNWLLRISTGVSLHDQNCGLKCFKKDVTRVVSFLDCSHRIFVAMCSRLGFAVDEIPVSHRKRQFGSSSYGFRRYLDGIRDLISFSACLKALSSQNIGNSAEPST